MKERRKKILYSTTKNESNNNAMKQILMIIYLIKKNEVATKKNKYTSLQIEIESVGSYINNLVVLKFVYFFCNHSSSSPFVINCKNNLS